MPLISILMGPLTHKAHIQKSDRIQAEVHDSKHTVQNFHTCLGEGITECDVTVIDYRTSALCFKVI